MTRRDLSPGYQATQAMHAAIDFVLKYLAESLAWHKHSNYLCNLSVENEEQLFKLLAKAEQKGIKAMPFYEPDLGGELTAITFEPTIEAKKLTSSLPLMLKENKTVPV